MPAPKFNAGRPLGRFARKPLNETADKTGVRVMHNFANISVLPPSRAIQRKLKIGQPNDKDEQEADSVADRVMSMPEPNLQRKCKKCEDEELQRQEDEEEDELQQKPLSNQITPLIQRQEEEQEEEETVSPKSQPGRAPEVTPGLESDISSMKGGGSPLPDSTRAFMEPRFGHDFSKVRVHTDSRAADTAQSINAKAFTVGNNIAFNSCQYSPSTISGKRLLSHELAHVIQKSSKSVVRRVSNCTSELEPDQVISEHKIDKDTIEKPGDKVKITVKFPCKIRSWVSVIESKDGAQKFKRKIYEKKSDEIERTWDGKKLSSKVGTFLVDDGSYIHKLQKVKYAFKYNSSTKKSDDVFAEGEKLSSPEIKVQARKYKGGATDHYHHTKENIIDLAKIIISEIGVGSDIEKKAIAWAVRNQMLRILTGKVANARDKFKDAHSQAATGSYKKIAGDILKKKMSDDITSGAFKWFSPQSMPKKGESCKGMDCSGGLIEVADDKGNKKKVYAPGFHEDMTYTNVAGVREWFMRFYRL